MTPARRRAADLSAGSTKRGLFFDASVRYSLVQCDETLIIVTELSQSLIRRTSPFLSLLAPGDPFIHYSFQSHALLAALLPHPKHSPS